MATRVSMEGLVEIASHEGIVNAPYRDSVGVWTVGIGHTASAGPPDPAKRRGEYSIPYIMDIFSDDIGMFEQRVRDAFTVPLKQHEFDAAVSFDFNTGGIDRATWVRKFNAGDRVGARKAFMNWSKPAAIIPRRRKERDLFFNGTYSNDGTVTLWPADSAGNVLWRRGQPINLIELMDRGEAPDPTPLPTPKPTGKAVALALTGIGGAIALCWDWLMGLLGF